MSALAWWRAWRLDQLRMKLADAEAYYEKWVTPGKWSGTLPSEDRHWRRKIERLERKVEQAVRAVGEDPEADREKVA